MPRHLLSPPRHQDVNNSDMPGVATLRTLGMISGPETKSPRHIPYALAQDTVLLSSDLQQIDKIPSTRHTGQISLAHTYVGPPKHGLATGRLKKRPERALPWRYVSGRPVTS